MTSIPTLCADGVPFAKRVESCLRVHDRSRGPRRFTFYFFPEKFRRTGRRFWHKDCPPPLPPNRDGEMLFGSIIEKWKRLMDFVRLLLVFLLPPAAVYMQFGSDHHFWISCVLTLFGFIPGVIYSLYIMATRPPGLSRLQ